MESTLSTVAGADVLVDTDVLVDHLRLGRGFEPRGDRVSYSVITRAELFAGRNTDEPMVRLLLDPFRELPVDRNVAEFAGRIRRESGIRLPDALIAATAVVHGLTLLSRNRRDFERVPQLRLRDHSG